MAKGRRGPYCGNWMYAESEEEQPKGSWVVYVCRNSSCKHKEKIFESK
jgi:hypothetical protein